MLSYQRSYLVPHWLHTDSSVLLGGWQWIWWKMGWKPSYLQWDNMRQLPWDTMRHSETFWDILRHHETSGDIFIHQETLWDTIKCHKMACDSTRHNETLQLPWGINEMRHHEIYILRHHENIMIIRYHKTSWCLTMSCDVIATLSHDVFMMSRLKPELCKTFSSPRAVANGVHCQ